MGWQALLKSTPSHLVAPWLGGKRIFTSTRAYTLADRRPPEIGWYLWEVHGRKVNAVRREEPDPAYFDGRGRTLRGYLVGDRFIEDTSRLNPDPEKLVEQTATVYLVEPGLDRFTPVEVVRVGDHLLYHQQIFPMSGEDEVRQAFVDREPSVDHLKGIVPALDLAFRFVTQQRELAERRRAEMERRRLEQERLEEARRSTGTGLGRRSLAVKDFHAAARAALAVGRAELLDVRPGRVAHEAIVQYRCEHRRLECVADRRTLRILDAGVCLTNEQTGEKGDTYFTLESLPAVIRQAIAEHKLVVYRHVDGDEDY